MYLKKFLIKKKKFFKLIIKKQKPKKKLQINFITLQFFLESLSSH